MPLTGVIVNAVAVLFGGFIGTVFQKKLSEKITGSIMTALGLCTVVIGISGALGAQANARDSIVFVLSIILGTAVGTLIDLNGKFEALGRYAEVHLFHPKEGEDGKLAKGFVSASLLFCIGAMVIIGAIESGIRGVHNTYYLKAILDCTSAMMLAASLGAGVMLSSVSIFVVQGAFTLVAHLLGSSLSAEDPVIAVVISVGSLIVATIGLNLAGITKVKIADMIPAFLFVPPLFYLFDWLTTLVA